MNGMGVELDNYEYMSNPQSDNKYPEYANANHVYARLTGDEEPQMPLGEESWNAPIIRLDKRTYKLF